MIGSEELFERHLKRPTLSRYLLQESALAAESIGPWFLTVLCLFAVGVMANNVLVQFYLFVTYATACSLIVASPLHAVLAEYLGRQIFIGKTYSIVNGMLSDTILTVVIMLPLAALLVSFSEIPLNQKMLFVILTTLLSLLWAITSLLGILDKSLRSFVSFFIGLGVMVIVARLIHTTQLNILVSLFILGMTIPVGGGYAYVLKTSLRQEARADWTFFRHAHALKVGGAFLSINLGFWIDKFLFWFLGPTAERTDRLFQHCPEYDYPFFVAFTLMMLAMFLGYRKIKSKVKLPFQAFIFKLNNNYPFWEIDLEKAHIVNGINEVISDILLFYGGTVITMLLFVAIGVLAIPWQNPYAFYYLLIGTVFYALYFFAFLILQHLDDYGLLLQMGMAFLCLNTLCTYLSILAGRNYYGAGFMVAAILAAIVALITTNAKIGALEYEIFKKAAK